MRLNKYLYLILISALSSIAPTKSAAQLRYGFNFGGSFSGVTVANNNGYEPVNRSGFRGGLTIEYQMKSCGLAFDGSILYNRINTRLRKHTPNAETIDFGRNYLEIPIHLKYKFWLPATSNLVAPMILTGPTILCHLSPKKSEISVKRIQPGWDVGIGVDVANILQVSGGYRFGLTDIAENSSAAPPVRIKNSGFFLSALILFDF